MRRSVNGRDDASQPAGAKLTLLVGHDTNLANIGGMLGIHWSLPSYLPDQTPPAGALHFELLRGRQTGIHGVRVRFISQTPEQMRQTAPLDRAHPPEQATASIEGCATSASGICPWTAFDALASKAIDRACAGKE
jgi:4-phytase/acid phosphatase